MKHLAKAIFFSAVALAGCTLNSDSEKEQEILLSSQQIGIESVHNARQLGGYYIGNKQIKQDLLIRCGTLSNMSAQDSALLSSKYRVQCIYDFRDTEESISNPDVVPAGALYKSLAVMLVDNKEESDVDVSDQQSIIKLLLENADHPQIQAMCTGMYDRILFSKESQESYRKFFAHLVTLNPADGAILWHCTQGKDRAGCASAMILAALGANRNLIMADFMLSKDYYDPLIANIEMSTDSQRMVISTLMSANPELFQASLDKIDQQYGSFENYLTECIGVTPQMIKKLREQYLK